MNPLLSAGGVVPPAAIYSATNVSQASPDFTGREFAAGVVTGVRSFSVDRYTRLTGIHKRQVWRPGENLAECLAPKASPEGDFDPADVLRYDRECLALDAELRSRYGFGLDEAQRGGPRTRGVYFMMPREPKRLPGPAPKPHSMAECMCGFYGYFDGSDDYRTTSTITGVVEGYGETILGTRGFRVGKARIVALCTRSDEQPFDAAELASIERLQRIYAGIPFFDRFDDLVTAFPPDRALEISPENDPDFWTRK